MKYTILVMIFALLLIGCEAEGTPSPDDDGPILVGVDDMPKQVATIRLSPTPLGGIPSPTPVPPTIQASSTPEPPEPTMTPTAPVGVFVGDDDAATIPPISLPSGGVGGTGGTGSNGGTGGTGGPNSGGSGGFPGTGGTGTGIGSGGAIVEPPGFPPNSGLGRRVPDYCFDRVNESFKNTYTQNPDLASLLNCPVDEGYGLTLVGQTFERGQMFWRDTNEIYALPSTGRYYRIEDQWREGMPESDSSFVPPTGLQQPIRGFGLAWRNNQAARDALGWALTGEAAFLSYWQDFRFGSMFLADNNQVYAFIPDFRNPNEGVFYGPFIR